MGLDTTYGCYSGTYTGFMAFRETLAAIVGLDLEALYSGKAVFPKKKEEPLVILLDHSDCDGHINWKDTEPLANRLEQILKELPKHKKAVKKYYDGDMEYLQEKIETFIEGLRIAYESGDKVKFR